MKKIYFDYAATSIKRKKILEKILENADKFDGNPDSSHAFGREAKKILEDARRNIAESINANPSQIIFTSGASESNNTVLSAFADQKIITTNIEHDSIENTYKPENTILLGIEKDTDILEALKAKLTDEVKLVSIMMVNNETGFILPIKEIGEFLRDRDVYFHVDCVQAYGHIDIDVDDMGIDFLSLSGHKIGGINGFGVLFARENLPSFIKGGEQEKYRRAGTSFVMGAYSMAKSFPYMVEERVKIKELKNYLINSLGKTGLSYEINGNPEKDVDHIINIYFKDYRADFLLTYLDMHGIGVSAGSACRAGAVIPSKVVERIYGPDRAKNSLRISLGFENTKEDIDKLIEVLGALR
ncbi:cysteine desulfurase [Anaerococcus sp. NML200537]|uniref:cysteine desulfurase family protein n=1 Tax=Anaerococcus sp. NML200537 TaxID=2954485 RepID=UPI0022389BD4|nr:cysteine desulfurase family protein [Anaerococcus sp. NML200537]MCW6701079.1 cysteine desulfurase [Anaerococcus sp. NML200537]